MVIEQALLEKIKTSVRISHNALDLEVVDNIQAAVQDLRIHGITHAELPDPLILNAVKLYVKAEYTDDQEKAATYRLRYKEMRDCLKAAEGYGWKSEVAAGE